MGLKKRIEQYALTVDCSMAIARKRVKHFETNREDFDVVLYMAANRDQVDDWESFVAVSTVSL